MSALQALFGRHQRDGAAVVAIGLDVVVAKAKQRDGALDGKGRQVAGDRVLGEIRRLVRAILKNAGTVVRYDRIDDHHLRLRVGGRAPHEDADGRVVTDRAVGDRHVDRAGGVEAVDRKAGNVVARRLNPIKNPQYCARAAGLDLDPVNDDVGDDRVRDVKHRGTARVQRNAVIGKAADHAVLDVKRAKIAERDPVGPDPTTDQG
jgi:hypothetical protein